jgi:D-alanyl-lipoteichoic acid acyltransferase DltB (MBOAT superfamily)
MFFIPIYLSILLFTIIVDYIAGILIEQANDPRKRTGLLAISIFANTGILFIFKYFNFFDANIAAFANLLGWNYELHTPIALSQCENGAKRLAV